MTVCIGAICGNKNSVVIAADRMVTLQLPPTEFEHTASKIDVLTDKSLFLSAGLVLPATEIHKRASTKLKTEKITSIEEIARIVCEVYKEYRAEKVEEAWLIPRKLTLNSFYNERKSQDLPKELSFALDSQMIKFNLGVEIMIAGVDEAGGHIYTVLNPGVYNCHDKIGFVAIGSGSMHATSTFISNNYSIRFNLNNGAYCVFESKFSAERSPGVGADTDMAIVTNQTTKFLEQGEIVSLRETCLEITKPKTKQEEELINKLPFEAKLEDGKREEQETCKKS